MDKTYLKNTVISVLTSLLSIFFIFYIINQVNIIGRNDVAIQYVSADSSEVKIPLEGILCFSEQVIYATGDYVCIPSVENGTGVMSGESVGKLYSSLHSDTVELISRIDERITYLEHCSDVRGGVLDSVDYDKQLKDSYNSLIDTLYSGNLAMIDSSSDAWLTAKSRRNVSIGIIGGYKTLIDTLKAQRDALLLGIGPSAGEVYSRYAGVYYSFTDGFEEIISENTVVKGSYADLNGLFDQYISTDKSGGMGKVVTSGKWYNICRVSPEEANLLKVGSLYPAKIEEAGKTVSLTLERALTEYGNQTAILVFSCDTDLEEIIKYRQVSFDLTIGSYVGLGVPCSAVRYVDGNVGVYIVDGNKARFRKIEILAEAGGRYIVKMNSSDSDEEGQYLKLYDSIITSGKNVYDGRYVELG